MSEEKNWLHMFDKEFKNMIPPNVLVIGKTGVGKSTLINAMFNGKIAETGVGEPVSAHLQKYTKEGVPIAIWDSRGLELDKEAQESVINEVKQELRALVRTGDATAQIHVCWYCINDFSNRIEQTEVEWIRSLSEELPVILVLTQTYSRKKDDFFKVLQEMNLPVRQIARVLAERIEIDDDVVIEPHGLKELSQITFQLLPEQLKKAFAAAQKVDIEEKARTAWKEAKLMIGGSGVAAALPVGADITAIGTLQVSMLARITHIFGLKMGKQFFLAVIGGIGGRIGLGAIAGFVLGKLAKLSGFAYVAGVAIDSAITVAVSTALASAYINVCKRMVEGKLAGMDDEQIVKIIQDEFERKRNDGKDASPDGFE